MPWLACTAQRLHCLFITHYILARVILGAW
jgi:hypothetical protein